MVDRFHYLRQFAGEPVDAAALDTLTTMVHRALFGGRNPPVGVPADGRADTSADGRSDGRAKKTH
jgi:hypothetical protein